MNTQKSLPLQLVSRENITIGSMISDASSLRRLIGLINAINESQLDDPINQISEHNTDKYLYYYLTRVSNGFNIFPLDQLLDLINSRAVQIYGLDTVLAYINDHIDEGSLTHSAQIISSNHLGLKCEDTHLIFSKLISKMDIQIPDNLVDYIDEHKFVNDNTVEINGFIFSI